MSQKDRGAVEALIEVTRSDCSIANSILSLNSEAKIECLKPGDGKTLHRVETCQESDTVIPHLQKIATNVSRVGKTGFWAEVKSCSACKILSSSSLVLLSSRTIDSKRIHYRILIQSLSKLKVLERELEAAGLKPVVLEADYENSSTLTDREKEIVNMAYRHGYFEPERGISMTEVAHIMRVSTPSVSDVLRRGTKKMIRAYVKNKL